MDDDRINEWAEFKMKNLSPEEKERMLEGLAKDPMMAFLLNPRLDEASPLNEPVAGLPFPVLKKTKLGVCQGFVRLFEANGIDIAKGLRPGVSLLRKMGGGGLPLCIRREIKLDVELPARAMLKVRVQDGSDTAELSIDVLESTRRHDYLEVWENGTILMAQKMEKSNAAMKFSKSAIVAIRAASSHYGIGLRVSPIQFTVSDWISAAVFCSLEGDFAHASSILRKVGEGHSLQGIAPRVRAGLETLRGLTKVENFTLLPAPATRSGLPEMALNQILERFREGVAECWPGLEACLGKDASMSASADPAVLELLAAANSFLSGGASEKPRAFSSQDIHLQEGWAALQAYGLIADGKSSQALAALESIKTVSDDDPFGLVSVRSIARHLVVCERRSSSSSELEQSTLEVWRAVFTPLITALSRPSPNA